MFYDTTLIDLGFREPDFKNLRWVLKVSEGWGVLNLLLIEDGQAIKTDGHRIHICHLHQTYPDGLYEILSNHQHRLLLGKPQEVKKFPDWKSAIPAHIDFNEIKNLQGDSQGYSKVIRQMDPEETLDYRYFADLGKDNFYTGYIYDKKKPVIFLNFDWTRVAVIMPMHM